MLRSNLERHALIGWSREPVVNINVSFFCLVVWTGPTLVEVLLEDSFRTSDVLSSPKCLRALCSVLCRSGLIICYADDTELFDLLKADNRKSKLDVTSEVSLSKGFQSK